MTEAEAMALVAALAAAYPRQTLQDATLRLYAQHLGVLPPHVGKAAVERCIASSKWFPTIAEIRSEVAAMTCSDMPDPEVAWEEVLSELRRVGHTRAPEFSCPEIGQAVRAVGGWMHLCLTPTNAADRARFVDAYRSCYERSLREAQYGERLLEESVAIGCELRGDVAEVAKAFARSKGWSAQLAEPTGGDDE